MTPIQTTLRPSILICDQIRNKWCIVYMAFDCSIDPSFSAGEPFPFLHYHRIWAHYLGLKKCFYLTCFCTSMCIIKYAKY